MHDTKLYITCHCQQLDLAKQNAVVGLHDNCNGSRLLAQSMYYLQEVEESKSTNFNFQPSLTTGLLDLKIPI